METLLLSSNQEYKFNDICKKQYTTKHHNHKLLYLTYEEKKYNSSGWSCDICKTGYDKNHSSMHCTQCKWDLCDNCFFNEHYKE